MRTAEDNVPDHLAHTGLQGKNVFYSSLAIKHRIAESLLYIYSPIASRPSGHDKPPALEWGGLQIASN